MANTLVGVYDKFNEAQSTYDELLSCGFDRSDLQLSPADESSDARQAALSTAGTTTGETEDHSFGAGIRRFFHDLFSGSDEYQEHADVYAEAVRRGHYLVTVHADNDEERVQATQVMNRFNPVDIDERAAGWRSRGWSKYDENAPSLTDSEIVEERRHYSTSPSSATTSSAADASAMGSSMAAANASDATIADTSRTRADTSAAADTTYSVKENVQENPQESTAATNAYRTEPVSAADTTRTNADTIRTDAATSTAATSPAMSSSMTDKTTTDRMTSEAATTHEPATTRMSDTDMTARQAATAGTSPESRTIPVIQEELQVGKREIQRGGVRVYQRVKETPVDESVRLHEEHVHVERHPVDRQANEADLSGLKESSFELRETAEEAVVGKTARIVEEVVVSKEASERTQEIHDKVRRTDVEVEQLGASDRETSTGMASGDEDFRRHFQTAYGTNSSDRFEDYEPAYRYGSSLAGDDRFRGHKWDESEEDVHADWDSHYGSATPWEKAKNAVKYGWERATR